MTTPGSRRHTLNRPCKKFCLSNSLATLLFRYCPSPHKPTQFFITQLVTPHFFSSLNKSRARPAPDTSKAEGKLKNRNWMKGGSIKSSFFVVCCIQVPEVCKLQSLDLPWSVLDSVLICTQGIRREDRVEFCTEWNWRL